MWGSHTGHDDTERICQERNVDLASDPADIVARLDAEGAAAVIEQAIRNATREREAKARQQFGAKARQQLKEAQSAAQERLARLLTASPAVIYSFKATGDYAPTFVSDNIVAVFGYAPVEYLENPSFWRDRVQPGELAQVEDAIAKFFQNGVHTVEYRFRRKDGSYCWVNDEQHLIRDSGGKPLEIVGSWSDITARKSAEEAKAAAHARLSQLLTSSPAAIYSYRATEDFAPTFVSENVKDWLGYGPQEYLQDPNFWRARVHPDELDSVEAQSVQLFKKGRHTVEYRFLRKDGSYCWVNDAQQLIRDDKGQPAEVVGSWSDISERKQAEDAAAAARERAEHLLARSPAVICSFKATGDYAPTFISQNIKICSATSPRNISIVLISGETEYIRKIASVSWASIRGYLRKGGSASNIAFRKKMEAIVGSTTNCNCCAMRRATRPRWWVPGTTLRPASRSVKPWSSHRIGLGACCRLHLL